MVTILPLYPLFINHCFIWFVKTISPSKSLNLLYSLLSLIFFTLKLSKSCTNPIMVIVGSFEAIFIIFELYAGYWTNNIFCPPETNIKNPFYISNNFITTSYGIFDTHRTPNFRDVVFRFFYCIKIFIIKILYCNNVIFILWPPGVYVGIFFYNIQVTSLFEPTFS